MNWKELLCTDRKEPTRRQIEEGRDEIHRDYGRVVFSTPVRRLQDKAQVFPLEPIDAVRTRLTHSMEVSSVAKGLAHVVAQRLEDSQMISREEAYNIENIAATCGLIHDLGNPPFGHAGEEAIQGWFKKQPETFWQFDKLPGQPYKTDLINFEGNAQTVRLLATLQVLSNRAGLNLTYATLSAAIKYTAESTSINPKTKSKKKLGFFQTEKELIQTVWQKTGTRGNRNPITFMVEASDDMVYSVVDIEDGIKKGVLSWGDVKQTLKDNISKIGQPLFDYLVTDAEKRILGAPYPITGKSFDEMVSQYFRTRVIVKANDAVRTTFIRNYDAIMNGDYDNELIFDSEVAGLYQVLQDEIGKKRVYNSKSNLRLELLGNNVIHFLLDTFFAAEQSLKTRTFPQKTYHLLSQNYRTVFENPTPEEQVLPKEYRKALLVTDYICGMTDSFALNLQRELQHG